MVIIFLMTMLTLILRLQIFSPNASGALAFFFYVRASVKHKYRDRKSHTKGSPHNAESTS